MTYSLNDVNLWITLDQKSIQAYALTRSHALFIKKGTLLIPSTVLFTCMQFQRFFSAQVTNIHIWQGTCKTTSTT